MFRTIIMITFSTKLHLLLVTSAIICFHPSLQADQMTIEEEKKIQENFTKLAEEPGSVIFTPPKDWHLADMTAMPPSVQIMVVGKGSKEFPPSMNLATENYKGSLKQYLKIVKEINDSQGAEWKDLGTIRTEAGDASMSQVDSKSEWGEIRMMHVILIKNGTAYILTAAALKDEFPKFYKDFFTSMRSLRINKDLLEMITDARRRSLLEKSIIALKKNFKAVQEKEQASTVNDQQQQNAFASKDFQNSFWIPFQTMLAKDFNDMGTDWQKKVMEKIENELID
jgi:hypothetical protein